MHRTRTDTVVDVLGVGFGPANLALAVALTEAPEAGRPTALSVEQKPRFSWHPGMLLEGTRAQVPFFKDLATLRNPTSRFTYLNWLHERGLLFQFIASRDFTPLRSELDTYYRWAAEQFADQVRYGQRVAELRPDAAGPDGQVELLRAVLEDVRTGERSVVRARSAVLAPGGTPYVPACVAGLRDRVFHTSDFLEALTRAFPDRSQPYRFLVVGAGQSAGDSTRYLLDEYPQSTVELVFRGYAPRPLDESPFVNELFDREARDLILSLPRGHRDALLAPPRELLGDRRVAAGRPVPAAAERRDPRPAPAAAVPIPGAGRHHRGQRAGHRHAAGPGHQPGLDPPISPTEFATLTSPVYC